MKNITKRSLFIGPAIYLAIEFLLAIYRYFFERISDFHQISFLTLWSYFPTGFIYESFSNSGPASDTPFQIGIIIIINLIIFSTIGFCTAWIYKKIKKF